MDREASPMLGGHYAGRGQSWIGIRNLVVDAWVTILLVTTSVIRTEEML